MGLKPSPSRSSPAQKAARISRCVFAAARAISPSSRQASKGNRRQSSAPADAMGREGGMDDGRSASSFRGMGKGTRPSSCSGSAHQCRRSRSNSSRSLSLGNLTVCGGRRCGTKPLSFYHISHTVHGAQTAIEPPGDFPIRGGTQHRLLFRRPESTFGMARRMPTFSPVCGHFLLPRWRSRPFCRLAHGFNDVRRDRSALELRGCLGQRLWHL